MGQCCTRKKLVCHIQQQLINLNEEQLYRLADVLSGEISVNVPTITGTNGADLVEYILSLSQGVSQLLLVQDLITKMMGESDSNTTIMEKNTTQQESNIFGPSDTSTHISHDQDTDDVTIPDTANAGTSDTPPAGLMIGDPDIYTTTREKNTTQQESNIYGLSDTSTHTGHEQEPKDITVPDTTNAGTSDMPPACLMIGDPDIYTTTREKNTTQQESNIYGLSDTSTHTGHEQEPKDITVPDTTNAGTSDMPPAGLMIGDPDIYTTSREKNTTQQESNIFRLSDTSTHISRELDPEDVTVPETVNAGMSDGVSEKVKDEDANKHHLKIIEI
ncbi:hypothetical protein UPYG_G00328840 [Umbra pygmaea]|uniref:Uncharacterized protein n=1 Tax=Umbra pygmaea TaxID=75934 RepID=A0ABD0W2N4_UMBPY